jgi:hypothetical protein
MPFVPAFRKRSYLGLYVPEWILIAFTVVVLSLYELFGFRWRKPLWLLWERILSGGICYIVGLLIALLMLRLLHLREGRALKRLVPHQVTWKIFREHWLTRSAVLFDLRMVIAVAYMFLLFIHMKHLIPWVNDNMLDAKIFRFEEKLFGGVPAEQLQSLFGTGAAHFLSLGYTSFFGYLAVVLTIFIVQRQRDWTLEFLSAFFLLWLGALLIVYLLPTTGPCFFDPSTVQYLPETEVSILQSDLWRHKMILETNPNAPNAMYLISGLPSLHLAAIVLGSLYLSRIGKVWAGLSWLFAALTVVTTIYFGWHYVLDDVLAVLLALGARRAALRYFSGILVYRPDPAPARR